MKPEQLYLPFAEGKRETLHHDRVLYVPSRGELGPYAFPGWNHPSLFANENPVQLEYCSGNGAWIAAKAAAFPEINWVAVEKKFSRARKIWAKIKNLGLKNLFVVSGEAQRFSHHYLPENTLDHIFINFPDPWPKARHHKNRLIQDPFIEEMLRILKKEGTLTFVTDDRDYSDWTIEILQNHGRFQPLQANAPYVTEYPDYGTSYFEDLWREKGKTIRYHLYKKIG